MLDTKFVKRRRKELGLTQQRAAELAGLRFSGNWGNIESGTRSNLELKTVLGIARALQCTLDELVHKERIVKVPCGTPSSVKSRRKIQPKTRGRRKD